MAPVDLSASNAARRDFTPDLMQLVLWATFILLLLAMLAPQLFAVFPAADPIKKATWTQTSIAHQKL